MPLRPVARNPNGWDQNALPTKFRRLDTPRVKRAAAIEGVTVCEFIRRSTLKEVERLGIRQMEPLKVETQAQTFAITAPRKAQEARSKTHANITAFREQAARNVPGGQGTSVTRETFGQTSVGMKDTPPRL